MVRIIGHLFHQPSVQEWLLAHGNRDEIIEWLLWNDGNGIYTDEDSVAEGYLSLTLATARDSLRRVLSQQ